MNVLKGCEASAVAQLMKAVEVLNSLGVVGVLGEVKS